MGREIRRVPLAWNHPTYGELEAEGATGFPGYQRYQSDQPFPCRDEEYSDACEKWMEECMLWAKGYHPDQAAGSAPEYYWDANGGPLDECRYRHGRWSFRTEEAMAYQIYETVTEGTPVSPVFETKEAMETWLVTQGHSRNAARRFCETGWAPSMIVTSRGFGSGIDALDLLDVEEC